MSVMPSRRLLQAVREQRGLSIEAVAAYTSIAIDSLARFEEGIRAPSRKQAEKLADTYGVPLYALFGKSIPNLPPLPQDFRKTDPAPATLSPRGIHTLLSSESISHFARQLALELNYQPASLIASIPKQGLTAVAMAAEIRTAFDEWIRPRAANLGLVGSPEQKFMSAFRLFIEIQGGVLNVNDAPEDDYLGFFVSPEGGLPTIFINRSISSKKAQLFTLAHEYAHARLGEGGISDPFYTRNKIERFCNAFAAEFLAPMEQFKKQVESLAPGNRSEVATFVNAVSAKSLLSRHAAAIRLVESDYISRADFDSWRRRFVRNPRVEKDEEREAAESGGGVPHAKRISELGHLPIYLAHKAVRNGIIDGYDVGTGLRLSRTLQERAFSLVSRRFEAALA